jgi:hypothetical protein
MNKRALKYILEHALQTLEESFTYDRGRDYCLCGQIRAAYHKLYSEVRLFEESDDLPFHIDRSQPFIIMEYLRYKYSIDKSLNTFWWPIAKCSWQLSETWAEEGRRTRVWFLKTAIADLETELAEEQP